MAPTPIGTVLVQGWPKVRSSQRAAGPAISGIEHDVEVGLAQPGEVGGAGAHRRHHVDVDAQAAEQAGDLGDVVAVAEAQRRGAEQVAARPRAGLARRPLVPAAERRAGEGADQLVEGLGRAPVLLLLVGRQLQRHDRDRQVQRLGEPARVVLDQLGGAGGAHQHRLRLEALVGLARPRS